MLPASPLLEGEIDPDDLWRPGAHHHHFSWENQHFSWETLWYFPARILVDLSSFSCAWWKFDESLMKVWWKFDESLMNVWWKFDEFWMFQKDRIFGFTDTHWSNEVSPTVNISEPSSNWPAKLLLQIIPKMGPKTQPLFWGWSMALAFPHYQNVANSKEKFHPGRENRIWISTWFEALGAT